MLLKRPGPADFPLTLNDSSSHANPCRLCATARLHPLHCVVQASGGPAACWGNPPQLLLPQEPIDLQLKATALAAEIAGMHN